MLPKAPSHILFASIQSAPLSAKNTRVAKPIHKKAFLSALLAFYIQLRCATSRANITNVLKRSLTSDFLILAAADDASAHQPCTVNMQGALNVKWKKTPICQCIFI
jgi:hypothetical protein